MKLDTRPLSEITREAVQLLYKEIGAVNTIRFVNQFHAGYGNYTEERDRLFTNLTVDDIVAEIKRARKIEAERSDQGSKICINLRNLWIKPVYDPLLSSRHRTDC